MCTKGIWFRGFLLVCVRGVGGRLCRPLNGRLNACQALSPHPMGKTFPALPVVRFFRGMVLHDVPSIKLPQRCIDSGSTINQRQRAPVMRKIATFALQVRAFVALALQGVEL